METGSLGRHGLPREEDVVRSQAAVFYGPGTPLEIREVEFEEPGPGDVVVRMAAVGICDTDLHSVRGDWTRPTPMLLGHEGAGVDEVGAAVTSALPADPPARVRLQPRRAAARARLQRSARVGSEGTCVAILEATLRLVPAPSARALVVLGYPNVFVAADSVVEIMAHDPIGLEGSTPSSWRPCGASISTARGSDSCQAARDGSWSSSVAPPPPRRRSGAPTRVRSAVDPPTPRSSS
jgi:hypothetical protein